jgi:maltooligosyltrehalose trehalohydrolase
MPTMHVRDPAPTAGSTADGVRSVRRLPVGAEIVDGGVHFRVWAPRARSVEVVTGPGGAGTPMSRQANGYFEVALGEARAGTCYRFRLDGGPRLLADPASRFQPDGPHGVSQVVDPAAFAWTDAGWRGVAAEGQVLYELHVGTFTSEGTWAAAARELPALARLGVTVIELMPVADFAGTFGWGYDGVDLYAPTRLYGTPDDFRAFVDRAHAAGLGVILDVVYNHVGPDGSVLREFAEAYFTRRHAHEWGDGIDYDGPDAGPVREFFVANAGYWIDEFHLDGLRLDATQTIHDASPDHVLAAITRRVREAARGRRTLVVAENEPQDARLVRPVAAGGFGMDALWNDDFHHAARAAATGRGEAYYQDYRGSPQELISAVKWGYLYQGQRSRWQGKARGTPAFDVAPAAFTVYLQNHDQVANSGRGRRLHELTSPGRLRALTALQLLGPGTPLLFQGQEFCASSPWLFFADHRGDLADAVRRGRRQFLGQFPGLAAPEAAAALPDPCDIRTFERCKLDPGERERHAEAHALHGDLLALRRRDPVLRAQRARAVDGAVLAPEALVLRFLGGSVGDRLLLVNLGPDLALSPMPEPLLAPPAGSEWEVAWSSEQPRYGGGGTPPLAAGEGWHLPGHAALLLAPRVDVDGCV